MINRFLFLSLGGASGRVLCESLQDEGVDDGTEAHEELAGAHPGEDRGTRWLLLRRKCVSCQDVNVARLAFSDLFFFVLHFAKW